MPREAIFAHLPRIGMLTCLEEAIIRGIYANDVSIWWMATGKTHADTNLANPRTSAWFMHSIRRDALLGGNPGRCAPCLVECANHMRCYDSMLVWEPVSMMPLGFHSKVVTGKA
eukprot:663036-Pelagomonas_calceolata.AAC.11